MTEPRRPGRHGDGRQPRLSVGRWAASEDAKLLWLLYSAATLRSLRMRALFSVLGFTAIVPLAMAYSELLPLPLGGRFILLPSAAVVVAFGFRHTDWGRRALIGYISGFVATGIYDCLRLSLTRAGVFPGDPIPGIGRLLLDDQQASWVWGYAWRFLGNGAGMGMAYAMLPWRGVRSGILYGSAICLGLFGVLAIWPVAQIHFFPLKLTVGIGAMAGHWVYGGTLGYLCARYMPPVRLARTATAPASSRPIPAPAPVPVATPVAEPGARYRQRQAPAGAPRRAAQPARPGAGGPREPALTGTRERQAVAGRGGPAARADGAEASSGGGNGHGARAPAGAGRPAPVRRPVAPGGPPRPGPTAAGRSGQSPSLGAGGGYRGEPGYPAPPGSRGTDPAGRPAGARGGGGGGGIGADPYPRPGGVGRPGGRNGGGPGAGLEDTAAWAADSFVALPPGGVPPSAISGELPVVPPLGPGRPAAQALPGGGGFPAPPPGSQTASRRQVVPSRARRHAGKQPKPW